MKSIVLNNKGSRLHQLLESACIRSSYLIADRVVSAGTSAQDIWFDEVFKKADTIGKLMVIEKFYQNTDTPMSEAGKMIPVFKEMSKVKHPSPQQIMARKSMEKTIDNLFKEVVNEMTEAVARTGLMELATLADGETYGFYWMLREDIEIEDEHHVPASKLLTLQLPDPEEGPELFSLPPEFMLAEFTGKGTVYYAHEPEAANTENCWMHKCFTLPNINLLKAVELQAVREQLMAPGAEFRKQCDSWIKGAEGRSGEESVAQFRKNILPHAASLQAAVLQNEVLRHCSSIQNHEAKIELYMGEVPLPVLWHYFEHYNVIQEPTRKKLNELLENDNGLNRRIPIMHLSTSNTQKAAANAPAAKEELPEVQPVKKSISVD
jgi:hypothetical protein